MPIDKKEFRKFAKDIKLDFTGVRFIDTPHPLYQKVPLEVARKLSEPIWCLGCELEKRKIESADLDVEVVLDSTD